MQYKSTCFTHRSFIHAFQQSRKVLRENFNYVINKFIRFPNFIDKNGHIGRNV